MAQRAVHQKASSTATSGTVIRLQPRLRLIQGGRAASNSPRREIYCPEPSAGDLVDRVFTLRFWRAGLSRLAGGLIGRGFLR